MITDILAKLDALDHDWQHSKTGEEYDRKQREFHGGLELHYEALRAEIVRLNDKLEEVAGCFNATFVEGWQEVLAEGDIERIRDLWSRRISFAYHAALEAKCPTP